MNWTQQIDRCEFLLDYVHITIVSDKPNKLVKQLAAYVNFGKAIPERKSSRPLMSGKLALRSYFTFNRIRKAYLVHEKITGLQGINALLCIHDVPLLELVQVGLILDAVPAVKDYHFSCIEFRWDLYPKKTLSAVDLQKHLVRHLHLESAQNVIKPKGKAPRITYYINKRSSNLQSKIYIRPKKPNPKRTEFVRFELRARTNWFKISEKEEQGYWLKTPADFKKLSYSRLFSQVKWLDIDWKAVRGTLQSVFTLGQWRNDLDVFRDEHGMAKTIIEYRNKKICPPRCNYRGHDTYCRMQHALKLSKTKYDVVRAMRNCHFSVKQAKFEDKYTCDSKFAKSITELLKSAYKKWRQYPLFIQTPSKIQQAPKRKKSLSRKVNSSRKISKLKYQPLF